MEAVMFVEGPLDGMEMDVWEPHPDRLAMNLPEELGGLGVVFYELDEEAGEPCYRFAGWDYGLGADGLEP